MGDGEITARCPPASCYVGGPLRQPAFYHIDEDLDNGSHSQVDNHNLTEVPIEVVKTNGIVSNEGSDSEDPDYLEGDECDDEELEEFVDISEDEGDDIYDTVIHPTLLKQVNSWMYKNPNSSLSLVRLAKNAEVIYQLSDYDDSDDLLSLNGSDNDSSDNESKLKWPDFNEKADLHEDVELVVGMKFDSNVTFRKALREWTIKRGYDFKYIHNDKSRVTAICKERCGWRIHASPTQDSICFQIKSFNPRHECGRHYQNKRVTSKWVASKYLENFRDSPNWEASSLKSAVQRDRKVFISIHKAYRAKNIALKIIQDDEGRQFGKLWRYAAAIRDTNPGSTVMVKIEGHEFQRLYMCINACKKGFLAGCRKLIGVDGCHLKSKFKGQLLCAIGRDANDNMFPIAWAVVEIENKDSWRWFLSLLLEDIGSVEDMGWTFMSDQQKGLVEVFKEIMPNADHRFCVRHMHNNFKNAGFKGKTFKDLMWNEARAYRESEHKFYMNEIKKLDDVAFEWLTKFEPKLWCRYAHNLELKCNMLLNNIYETFNSYIKEARDKLIITMLEIIRRQLMKRFHVKRDGMLSYKQSICPRILQKLEVSKKNAMDCIVYVGGNRTYEVSHCFEGNKVVNLIERTCTCMKWQLNGIPCSHVVAAIFDERGRPEDYVDDVFSRENLLKAYDWHIHPVPGEEDWPECYYNEIRPPNVKTAPGRPKKKRNREDGEPSNPQRISKKGIKMKCGNCYMEGHNAKTCKLPSNPNRKVHKRPMKSAQMRRRSKKDN